MEGDKKVKRNQAAFSGDENWFTIRLEDVIYPSDRDADFKNNSLL